MAPLKCNAQLILYSDMQVHWDHTAGGHCMSYTIKTMSPVERSFSRLASPFCLNKSTLAQIAVGTPSLSLFYSLLFGWSLLASRNFWSLVTIALASSLRPISNL